MPSESMDRPSLSTPSFYSEKAIFPNEIHVGFWKTGTTPDLCGVKVDGKLLCENSLASSLPENQRVLGSSMAKPFDIPDHYQSQDQKVHITSTRQAVGAGRAPGHSLQRSLHHDPRPRHHLSVDLSSYFLDGNRNIMGDQYENSLFSSSLSELLSGKLRFSSSDSQYGQSVGAAAPCFQEEEPLESLEEIEAQTIGNLLPNDEEFLSSVTDGLDFIQPSSADDTEDLDLFSSVGGMELGEDAPSGQKDSEVLGGCLNSVKVESFGSVNGEHPFGEHPSRTLFVRNINISIEDSELRAIFEQYGEIHMLYTACKHRGFVMISYYDIRAALNALRSLQNKPLKRRKLDIHFSIPKDNPSAKDINQGTLVVFNLDASVSNDKLHQIFGVYGDIKEIHENPFASHQKIIEFYDLRAAEAALRSLNGSDIAGKQIELKPCHPGDAIRLKKLVHEMDAEDPRVSLQLCNSPKDLTAGISGPIPHGRFKSSGIAYGTLPGVPSAIEAPINQLMDNKYHHGFSSGAAGSLSSLVRVEPVRTPSSVLDSVQLQGPPKFGFSSKPKFHPHSLPEYHDNLANGTLCSSPGNMTAAVNCIQSERVDNWGFCRTTSNGQSLENEGVFRARNASHSPGNHYMWSNSHQPQHHAMMWPNSPSFINGFVNGHATPQVHAFPEPSSHMLNTCAPMNIQHVGSVPSVNASLWDRRQAFARETPDALNPLILNPDCLGDMRFSGNSPNHLDFNSPNMFSHINGNCMGRPFPSKNVGLPSHRQSGIIYPSRGQTMPMMSSFGSPSERTRSRKYEGHSNQADKKQYELDVDRIVRGEDRRTTLMIKNIPNKYTSKMLLAAIDEHHQGTYDFIYLPIDFKNKCNVGYAFINMTDPSHIIPFYQAFSGKKWEKFNSEKVAYIAYARIQGKAALISHFQNSSLMNEDKRCRPILFHTDGPNAGDQVPFPMGSNIRSRPNKNRGSTSEENQLESPQDSANGDGSSNGDSASGSDKGF